MNAINIMKDGTVRKSVEGVLIHSRAFYEVLNSIQKKQKK